MAGEYIPEFCGIRQLFNGFYLFRSVHIEPLQKMFIFSIGKYEVITRHKIILTNDIARGAGGMPGCMYYSDIQSINR